jgi:hypothetical protein
MKQSLDLHALGKQFSRLLLRFHVILYATIVASGLSIVIYLVSQTILDGSEPPLSSESAGAGFDSTTIEQLESLSQRSKNGKPLDFPTDQRINPFSE